MSQKCRSFSFVSCARRASSICTLGSDHGSSRACVCIQFNLSSMNSQTERLITTRKEKTIMTYGNLAAIRFLTSLVAVGLLLLLGTGSKLAAADYCSASTTVGKYLVVCDGYLTPGPNAPLTPAKVLSVASSNFAGEHNATGTASIGGQVVTQQVTGIAKVNPDCTGSVTYTQRINGQPAGSISFTFVISENGNRLDGLSTDPGSVLSCVLTRTSRDFSASVQPDSLREKPGTARRPQQPAQASSANPQRPVMASLKVTAAKAAGR